MLMFFTVNPEYILVSSSSKKYVYCTDKSITRYIHWKRFLLPPSRKNIIFDADPYKEQILDDSLCGPVLWQVNIHLLDERGFLYYASTFYGRETSVAFNVYHTIIHLFIFKGPEVIKICYP